MGFVQKRGTLETGNFLDYRDFYLIFDRVPAKVRYTVRPEGEYLCYYYKGPWEGIEAAYRKVFWYATEQKLLLDDRFARGEYTRLFPRHWHQLQYLRSTTELEQQLAAFWAQNQ